MQPVILSVLAHPDDETFGMGGTLAYYASRNVQVHLVCATLGEAGDVPEGMLTGNGSIADLRRKELDNAARILGLSGVHLLGYRDSGMPGTPDNHHPNALAAQTVGSVAAHIADMIREVRPQVVLTFDPIGGYKHPDHIAVHRATVEAFRLAGDPEFVRELPPYQPQKLYFHFMPKRWMRWTLRIMPLFGRDPRHWGRNGDIDLLSLVEEGDFPTHAVIDFRSVKERKDSAAACHASQLAGGPPRKGLMSLLARRDPSTDHFMRAVPPPANGHVEKDLFEGITLE